MLTPQDIQDKEFTKAVFGGYDMGGVDDFLEELSSDYAALYKENNILKSKLKVLVEKVEEYRSTEDAMRMALLTAQKMGDDLVSQAREQKERLLADAEGETRDRIAELNKQIADEQARLDAAKEQTRSFVAGSQALINEHMKFLDRLEQIQAPADEEEKPAVLTREEMIDETAREIENAVSSMLADEPEPENIHGAPVQDEEPAEVSDDEDEPTRLYKKITSQQPTDGEDSVTPRPKFKFDDLEFGDNYRAK